MRYNVGNAFLSFGTRQGHIFTCELLWLFGKVFTSQQRAGAGEVSVVGERDLGRAVAPSTAGESGPERSAIEGTWTSKEMGITGVCV